MVVEGAGEVLEVFEGSFATETNVGLGLLAGLLALMVFLPRLVGLNIKEALEST